MIKARPRDPYFGETFSVDSVIQTPVKIKKIHPDAKVPTYGTEHAAAFDFYTIDSYEIVPGFAQVFHTGLKIEIPERHVLLIFSRSGHGFKNDTRLSNCVGVIDADYRGEIMIKLKNDLPRNITGRTPMQITPMQIFKGDRIAQGIIMPYPRISFEVVEELSETARGEGGLGSTGR